MLLGQFVWPSNLTERAAQVGFLLPTAENIDLPRIGMEKKRKLETMVDNFVKRFMVAERMSAEQAANANSAKAFQGPGASPSPPMSASSITASLIAHSTAPPPIPPGVQRVPTVGANQLHL